MDTFVQTLITGTPVAILVALVGVLWELLYTRSRDKIHDKQMQRQLDLEEKKYEHQKKLEKLRFEYDQRHWKEELAKGITQELVKERINEYTKIWQKIERIASHHRQEGELTPDITRALAQEVKKWRYGKGGLLSEKTTRDVAYAFQKALWEYDGSSFSYKKIRNARRIFRDAIRSDIGLAENIMGKTLYEVTEERNNILQELKELQKELGISDSKEKE